MNFKRFVCAMDWIGNWYWKHVDQISTFWKFFPGFDGFGANSMYL